MSSANYSCPATAELPQYALRLSPRARRVRLTVCPRRGLTVVIPRGFNPALVPDIVRGRLEWATRHLERVEALRHEALAPPAAVELAALGRVWSVRYRARPGVRGVRLAASGGDSLEISGDLSGREPVREVLRTWLRREAARHLPPMLDALSTALGLPHAGLTVRLQRTRWGSCSASGAISLNARLLFLPPELARYVMVHELAHTLHLNHSPAYWQALESLLPGAKALDRQLRRARRHVPAWASG